MLSFFIRVVCFWTASYVFSFIRVVCFWTASYALSVIAYVFCVCLILKVCPCDVCVSFYPFLFVALSVSILSVFLLNVFGVYVLVFGLSCPVFYYLNVLFGMDWTDWLTWCFTIFFFTIRITITAITITVVVIVVVGWINRNLVNI